MGLTDTLRQVQELYERMIASADRAEAAEEATSRNSGRMEAAADRGAVAAGELERLAVVFRETLDRLGWYFAVVGAIGGLVAGLVVAIVLTLTL